MDTGGDGKIVRLSGQWTALALARNRGVVERRAEKLARGPARAGARMPSLGAGSAAAQGGPVGRWDLSAIDRLDHVGGQALWRAWGHRLPEGLTLTDNQRTIFERIQRLDEAREDPEPVVRHDPVTRLGLALMQFGEHLFGGIAMFGRVILDLGSIARRPKTMP